MASRNAYEVIVKILADASKSVSEFKRAETAADRMAKKTSDSMKLAQINTEKFAKQATIAGGVLIAAGTTMALGLSRTVKSAQEAEAAQLKLRNTIQGSANLGPRAMAAFESQAKAIQKVTVASDEAVMGVQSMLGQMGMTQRQVLALTPLVVDLSRKMGVDFNTAAKAVGKAVDGSTTGLKRMGVVVDATQAKLDPFGATVDALRRSAGGFAQQEGQTFAGQMAILNNQADELKESLGRGVLTVLTNMLPAVNNVAGAFVSLDDATGGTIGSISAFGTGLTLATGAALAAIGQFQNLKKTYDALTESSAAFASVSKAGPLAVGAALGTITGQKLAEGLLKGQKQADDGYARLFDANTNRARIRAWAQASEGEYKKSLTGLTNLGRQIGSGLLDVFRPLDTATEGSRYLRTLRDLSGQAFNKSFAKAMTLDPEAAQSMLTYIEKHDRLKRVLVENGFSLNKYRAQMKETVDTNHDGTRSMEELIAASARADKAMQEFQAATLDAGNQSRLLVSAQLDLDQATQSANQAQQDYNDALKSGDPKEIAKAQVGLRGALLQVAAAQDAVVAAGIKQAEQQLALQRIVGDDKSYKAEIQHLRDLRDAIDDPAIQAAIDKQIDNINRLRIVAGEPIDLNDGEMMASLWRLVAAGKVTEAQLHRLMGGPNGWQLVVNTKPAADALRAFAAEYKIPIRDIAPNVRWEIANARASGGPVAASTAYLVGERGPELFVPNSSGTIIPNSQLAAGGTMGSAVFNINVTSTPLATPAETGAAVVDALTAWQRRNGRLPLTVA